MHFGHDRLMSDYEVVLVDDNMQEFHVGFQGPKDSAPLWLSLDDLIILCSTV
jgi:hypothetical protein